MKTKDIVFQIAKYVLCVISILLALWVGRSTIEVWTGNVTETNFWFAVVKPETEMEVTACVKQGDGYYTVTVEDRNGNQWEYYDSDYREKGTQMCVSFNGNRITDAKEGE